MAGTRAGGLKASKSAKAKLGKDWHKNIGRAGGISPKTKPVGFQTMDALRHKELSAKGGANGKRGKWSKEEYAKRVAAYAEKLKEQEQA